MNKVEITALGDKRAKLSSTPKEGDATVDVRAWVGWGWCRAHVGLQVVYAERWVWVTQYIRGENGSVNGSLVTYKTIA